MNRVRDAVVLKSFDQHLEGVFVEDVVLDDPVHNMSLDRLIVGFSDHHFHQKFKFTLLNWNR